MLRLGDALAAPRRRRPLPPGSRDRPTDEERVAVRDALAEMMAAGIISGKGRAAQPEVVALAIAMHADEHFGTDDAAFDAFGLAPKTAACRRDWVPRLVQLDRHRATRPVAADQRAAQVGRGGFSAAGAYWHAAAADETRARRLPARMREESPSPPPADLRSAPAASVPVQWRPCGNARPLLPLLRSPGQCASTPMADR